jgi:hypothetical protein
LAAISDLVSVDRPHHTPADCRRLEILAQWLSRQQSYCDCSLTREDLKILAFRASTDCLCPAARFDQLCSTFPGRVLRHDVDFRTAHGHSVLAAEFHRQHAPTGVADAFDQTVRFPAHTIEPAPERLMRTTMGDSFGLSAALSDAADRPSSPTV